MSDTMRGDAWDMMPSAREDMLTALTILRAIALRERSRAADALLARALPFLRAPEARAVRAEIVRHLEVK